MRQAIVNALLADAELGTAVGQRIIWKRGPDGGLSREREPEFFDPDNEPLPTIVVVKEERVRPFDKPMGRETLVGLQRVALWCHQGRGFDEISHALRCARRVLHRARLTPVDDPVNWADCLWLSDSPELIDDALKTPLMVARFELTVTDRLT